MEGPACGDDDSDFLRSEDDFRSRGASMDSELSAECGDLGVRYHWDALVAGYLALEELADTLESEPSGCIEHI